MDSARMYRIYAERAKTAESGPSRTVHMLGMMCAAAVAEGGFFAFVGRGYGGDWPNPCENAAPGPLADRANLRRC